jgi:hypothetical protein
VHHLGAVDRRHVHLVEGKLLSPLTKQTRFVSEWRDRAGFNRHPDLIPAVNLLMQ